MEHYIQKLSMKGRKKMRKICSFLLSLMLVLSLCSGVGAKAMESNQQTISEYDMLREYEGKTRTELLQLGVEQETIDELFKLQETIKEFSTYSATDLKAMGFNDQQVYYLKKTKAEVSHSPSLSRSLSLSATNEDIFQIESFEKGLFAKVEFDISKPAMLEDHRFLVCWEWTGRPFIRKTDGIVVNWDGQREVQYNFTNLIYIVPNYTMDDFQYYKILKEEDIILTKTNGLGFTFDMDRGVFREYLKKGELSFSFDRVEGEEEITVVCRYAHTTLSKQVNIIINNDGNVDVEDRSTTQTLSRKTFRKSDGNF